MINNLVTQAELKAAIAAYEKKQRVVIQLLGDPTPAEERGGTWELVSQGRVLLGASDYYPLGSTGGEAVHTLTVNEMPSHYHKVAQPFENSGSPDRFSFYDAKADYVGVNDWTAYGNSTKNEGGSQPHNNMPPYLAVNIWHKISD